MEKQVTRVWTVLSAFEESSAACISEMLTHVSNAQYMEAVAMAEMFIFHVEVLFASIDQLELHFAEANVRGAYRSFSSLNLDAQSLTSAGILRHVACS
jgi:hypothetical protein